MDYKENTADYGLDLHCISIIEEYRRLLPLLQRLGDLVVSSIRDCLQRNNIIVTTVEGRIKKEASLAGKLELKGLKYSSLLDITDIVGARVVSFYYDEVDKIAALIDNIFDVDWENSVDKRKALGKDSFGYMSLHYVCRMPKSLYYDPECPQLNEIRFEVQMRTTLQHVWASMNHDTGYKSGVQIPFEYTRTLTRLAALLELADDEFTRLRRELADYRRRSEQLVREGDFQNVELDSNTFRAYLASDPFASLNRRIADINQAEIQPVNGMYYLPILLEMGFSTLGDIESLKEEYSDAAYQLAVHHFSGTDIDIMSSMIGLQNLCFVYLVNNGKGAGEITSVLDVVNGKSNYNFDTAARIFKAVSSLPFIKQKKK